MTKETLNAKTRIKINFFIMLLLKYCDCLLNKFVANSFDCFDITVTYFTADFSDIYI